VLSQIFGSEEELLDIKQILELGSGTGIGVMPLIKHYANATKENLESSMLPNLKEIVLSDYQEQLRELQQRNVKQQLGDDPESRDVQARCELIDWTEIEKHGTDVKGASLWLDRLGLRPSIIMATDIVYQGNPYDSFAKLTGLLCLLNPLLKVFVIMPTKDRSCSGHFIELMKAQEMSHQVIVLGNQYGFKAFDDVKKSDFQYPGLHAYEFDLHVFSLNLESSKVSKEV